MARRFTTFETDYYDGPRGTRYEEEDYRRGSEVDFLREDYGRTTSGPLVLREREIETFSRPSPRPPPVREEVREIDIIRERRRSPSPEPRIIHEPSVHREVVTHHRHIDHGVERISAPSPRPRPRNDSEEIKISIRRGESNRDRDYYDDEIIQERERERRRVYETHLRRRRSFESRRQGSFMDDDVRSEAEFYNRVAGERAYMGEAYNGATRDWTIVDVPPGTERVRMDGVGGGSQEITWQRYNGVRRSKFTTESSRYEENYDNTREYTRERRRNDDMWTEITKDLVVKDAMDEMGYEYEETEYFFYVMEYLRYEDVLQLVEISEDIRRERRERIREIQYERDWAERNGRRRSNRPYEDDRTYERTEEVYRRRRRSRYD